MLEWRENLSIGVDFVDNQHKEIFNRLNKLFIACSEGKCKEEIDVLVRFLENYVIEHFWDEEQLQKDSEYPDFERHKAEHEKFVLDVKAVKEKIMQDDSSNHVLDIYHLVSNWLTNHISQTDRVFGIYYREKYKNKYHCTCNQD